MKLLDTNVFLYALGREHPYRSTCQTILRSLDEEGSGYTTDAEVLQEILHVFTRKGERLRGIRVVADLLVVLPALIPIGGVEIAAAAQLLGDHLALSPRDAIHAAVVLQHGLDGIVSADRGFDEVIGLRRYDPIDVESTI